MKKILFASAIVFLLSCSSDPRSSLPKQGAFGQSFAPGSTVTVAEAVNAAEQGDTTLSVKGTITNYCKGEGCWMTLKNEGGEDLLITIKDKAFVLPKDIENKTATAHGEVKKETDSEGKETVMIEASGVIIE